jgi:hypothetical protein
MAPGEAWLFDNWRRHRVENPTDDTRIHLVADTSGTAAFWEFAARAGSSHHAEGSQAYRPGQVPALLTEHLVQRPVMPPAEVELLVTDLRGELVPNENSAEARTQLARYHWLLQSFCFDWRQLHAARGEDPQRRPEYLDLLEKLRAASRTLASGLVMRSNGIEAHKVLEGRLLRHLLPEP